MLPEIGHAALLITLLLTLINGLLPLLVASGVFASQLSDSQRQAIYASSRRLIYAQAFFVSLALCLLGVAFLSNDFSVAYVAQHSNILLPVQYKVSAIWGGHEGSLLLWLWILSAWSFLLALNVQKIPANYLASILSILSLVSLGFLAFIIFTSNPFDRLLPHFPLDGQDLNPLLQDFGLIIHPPMLYMGYVGLSLPFAFAVAGLVHGEFNRRWAAWSRPWTKSAWAFLGLGIALGSWWAYYELGWGGWWFWDPVENASLLPWLAGAALLHSLLMCEKRDAFRIWTVLLSIIGFSLSLLGTFLVRSGVLTSVHSFASDPSRGLFILVFLALVVGLSLTLFFFRAGKLRSNLKFDWLSKEFFLILNNIFLLVACFTVLLGTLFPIISDIFSLGKISVGPPYFNSLFFPMTILLMLFLVFVPQLSWRKSDLSAFKRFNLATLLISIMASLACIFVFYANWDWRAFILLSICCWVFLMLLASFNGFKLKDFFEVWKKMPVSQKNMHIAHFGFVVSIVGITITSVYSEEHDISLGTGESVVIADYTFTFNGIDKHRGPNYMSTMGSVSVEPPRGRSFELWPEKRAYFMQEKPMTEAAIDPGLFRDIYVALGEDLGAGKWSLRIYHKPLIRLIWLGAVIMAFSCLYFVVRNTSPGKQKQGS